MSAVLDASVVLAVINREPGAADARARAFGGLMSTVNLVEVGTRLVDWGMPPEVAVETINLLSIDIIDFDAGLAMDAAALRAPTKVAGLSLGDRACLALARREALPAVTADHPWAKVDVGVLIELIR